MSKIHSPIFATHGELAQLARAFAWHARGQGFDSPVLHKVKAYKNVGLFMIFTVYILYSQSLDKFYIGYTSDLEKRLFEHNHKISDFTSKAVDWILKHSEHYDSRELGMKREREIKKKKSRKYLEWLINNHH